MSIKFTKNPYEFDKCPSNKPLIPLLTLGIISHTHTHTHTKEEEVFLA